jgi:hypothetical protein
MHPKTLKQIDMLAKQLPPVLYHAALENSVISGDEAKLTGLKLEDGELLEDEMYLYKYPLQRLIDHKSRMKKAYKRRGKVGIIDYCSKYIKEDMMPQFVAFVNANFR